MYTLGNANLRASSRRAQEESEHNVEDLLARSRAAYGVLDAANIALDNRIKELAEIDSLPLNPSIQDMGIGIILVSDIVENLENAPLQALRGLMLQSFVNNIDRIKAMDEVSRPAFIKACSKALYQQGVIIETSFFSAFFKNLVTPRQKRYFVTPKLKDYVEAQGGFLSPEQESFLQNIVKNIVETNWPAETPRGGVTVHTI